MFSFCYDLNLYDSEDCYQKMGRNLSLISRKLYPYCFSKSLYNGKGENQRRQTPNSIHHSPLYKTDSCSATQEIHRILYKP
jgi:hypothetical protein